MTLGDLAFYDRILERLRCGQGSQHVGDGGARFPQPFGELLLGKVVRLHQQLVGASRLDGVEIGTLQILDESQFEPVPYLVANDRRNCGPTGESRREDPPVAGHELIAGAVLRYHYWLQNTVARNRSGELREALRVEGAPRLMAIWPHLLQRDLARRRTVGDGRGNSSSLPQQNVEAADEPAARHQAIAPPRAIGARARSRAETSRAKSSEACAAAD